MAATPKVKLTLVEDAIVSEPMLVMTMGASDFHINVLGVDPDDPRAAIALGELLQDIGVALVAAVNEPRAAKEAHLDAENAPGVPAPEPRRQRAAFNPRKAE